MDSREREKLLEQARAGDQQALGSLLQSYRGYLQLIVRCLRDGRSQAQVGDSDLIQEIYAEAVRGFSGFRGESRFQFPAWLRVIGLRTVRRQLRGLEEIQAAGQLQQSERELEQVLADSGPSPSALAQRQELAVQVADALDRLPEDMRQILVARELDGVPYRNLVPVMGRSEGALRILYVRALRRFRELVSREATIGAEG